MMKPRPAFQSGSHFHQILRQRCGADYLLKLQRPANGCLSAAASGRFLAVRREIFPKRIAKIAWQPGVQFHYIAVSIVL